MKELILSYEKEFFLKEFCDNLQNLNERIHDEFIEFGKSGMVFEKDLDIKALRTSIWVMQESCWKLYFHQGTPTDLNTLD